MLAYAAGAVVTRRSGVPAGPKLGGTLWAWGSNATRPSLGLGDSTNRSTPVQVGVFDDWIYTRAGTNSACAIRASGALYGWGYNGFYQLGLTDNSDRNVPTLIDVGPWQIVSMGNYHCNGIKRDGTLWGWGTSSGESKGAVGHGSLVTQTTPVQIAAGLGKTWVDVTCGSHHSLAVASDGTLWGWGSNWYSSDKKGQLGQGGTPPDNDYRDVPTQIGSATDWATVTAGMVSSGALKTDGTLWTWGGNHRGILGRSTTPNSWDATPTQVGSATDWTCAQMHSDMVIAVRAGGQFWRVGNNERKQVCNADAGIGGNIAPDFLRYGTDSDWWTTNDWGFYHGTLMKVDGSLWSWGANEFGQRGDGTTGNGVFGDTTADNHVPYQVPGTWLMITGGLGYHIGIKAV